MATRRPRTLQLVLAERLAHLDAHAWSGLTSNAGVFLGAPFLTALERALPSNVAPRYALLYRDDAPVAALALQVVRLTGRATVAPHVPLSGVAQLVDERAVVLGNLAAWGETALALRPGEDAAAVAREALDVVDRLRRFEKADGVVNVAFVKDTAGLSEGALRKAGFQEAPSGPDLVLTVDPAWRALDGYLASLSSSHRRAVKKTLQAVEEAGYVARPLTLEELEANEARLESLYGQVWANADVRPLKLSGRFFVELQRRLGAACVVTGLVRDGRVDAFGVSLRNGAGAVGYYLGFDRDVPAPLYLRLQVAVVEQAIAWRATEISMGRTAEEPKARLGAVPVPTTLWVKHRVPPLNWAVGAVLGSIEAPEAPAHRVFKKA
jgi:predicted N-acyltransferase